MSRLAEELSKLRSLKSWTLREVEDKTKGNVSNSYLSQLEAGLIKKPSPNILYELSKVYGASYPDLMVLAGYVAPAVGSHGTRGHGAVAFDALDLDAKEKEKVVEYVEFLRGQRKKSRS